MVQPKEGVWGKNINILRNCSAVVDIPLGAHLGPAVQFGAFSGQLPARSLYGVRRIEIIHDKKRPTRQQLGVRRRVDPNISKLELCQ